jgi:GWxTD domain-containing protein
VGLATRATAQTPTERDSIEQFRDVVRGMHDSVALRDLESRMIDRARVDRDNALLHVQLGFLAYRLGEVTGNQPHYDAAGSEFEWAAELEPEWPYPWYGLGLAELAMGEMSIIPLENIRQILGKDYLSKATAAFARATEVDPSFANAVVDLADAALRQRIRPRLDVALGAVRQAAVTEAGTVPAVQLARGRLERGVGSGDSALVAFSRYLEFGGDSGIGYLEIARSLYHVARAREAEATYFRGAELAASAEATSLYRNDVSWAASPEELAALDATQPEEWPSWLRSFWSRRDVLDVRAPGERLAEHYRRYFYALEHYRLVSRHRRYDVVNPYRTEQQVFDDRGIIYMRHGEPDRRAVFNAPDVSPNESWLYARQDGGFIFHFVAADDVQDYKLVESVADVLGLRAALELQAGGQQGQFGNPVLSAAFQGLFDSRVALDPVYQRLAAGQEAGRDRLLAAERRAGELSIGTGTITDSYPLRFDESLGAVVQNFVVGDAAGAGGQLLVVFAVPGSALAPEASVDGVNYRLHLRALAATSDDSAVAFVDTTQVVTTQRAFGPDEQVSGFLTLPVPPGDYTLRVAFAEPRREAGQLLTQESVAVPDFAADELILSDLIVGRLGSGLAWTTGSDTVDLSPVWRFTRAAPLRVYYELHGLEPDAGYRSRLEVAKQGGGSIFGWLKRLFGGGGPPISLTFEGVASGTTTRILQTVDISDLDPGRYRLRVTVEDLTAGQQVEREATLEVVGT